MKQPLKLFFEAYHHIHPSIGTSRNSNLGRLGDFNAWGAIGLVFACVYLGLPFESRLARVIAGGVFAFIAGGLYGEVVRNDTCQTESTRLYTSVASGALMSFFSLCLVSGFENTGIALKFKAVLAISAFSLGLLGQQNIFEETLSFIISA